MTKDAAMLFVRQAIRIDTDSPYAAFPFIHKGEKLGDCFWNDVSPDGSNIIITAEGGQRADVEVAINKDLRRLELWIKPCIRIDGSVVSNMLLELDKGGKRNESKNVG